MNDSLDQALAALLDFRLAQWHGLPPCLGADLRRLFGMPSAAHEAWLGAYPALREIHDVAGSPAGGLVAWSRAGRVVAVETVNPPPREALDLLGQPDARKPGEFALPGYLVSEYLYCRRGLVLSVAEPLDSGAAPRLDIARCRGIPVLASPQEYGAEYYLALQNALVFGRQV